MAMVYPKEFIPEILVKECAPKDHKWLYYNYEQQCRVCERIEPYKDKLRKAV